MPKVLYGPGSSHTLATHPERNFPEVKKVLIVTDAGFLKRGLVDYLVNAMQLTNLLVEVFSAVIADPTDDIVLQGVIAAKTGNADLVIGVVGGSSMDVAKLVALLVRSSENIIKIYGIDKVQGKGCPYTDHYYSWHRIRNDGNFYRYNRALLQK